VRAEGQRDAFEVDQDVGMVVGGFGVEREPRDERDRVGKATERVLLADGVPIEGPPVERFQPFLNFRIGQSLRHTRSIPRKRGQSPFFQKRKRGQESPAN
jgi:hypothetical protein